MTDERKREKPLGLDMDPDEALERFIGVDPCEQPDRMKLKKERATSQASEDRYPSSQRSLT